MAVDPGTLTSFDLNDTTPITTNTGAVVLTLTAESLFPQGSVGGTPTVSSSDTSIATVSASAFVLNSDSTAVVSDITITGVAIGTSTITVSFTDPGTIAHSVTATVTVEAPDYLDQSGLRHFWDKIKSLFIKNENGAVTTDLLANSAVTTAKINASAITNAKLATAAVQTTNILDGAVTSDKIDWTTLAPTSTTSTSSSMTWYKRVFPDGTIVYSGYGSPSWWTGGNTWHADIAIPLPDSLTFHPSKMLASINLQPADAAVQAWGSVHSGSTSWTICRGNRYSGDITTAVYINATLVVFPNQPTLTASIVSRDLKGQMTETRIIADYLSNITNINIITGDNKSGYSSCYVTIYYTKS